jgi:glycine/D-amino acid oxidase-like deaminating enzyme/nitrite reductase/ring-hydroxylating ferredoxin subunit
MHNNSGQTKSLWMTTAQAPALKPLSADTQADVCIVGAGIAGLTTAYLLAREGKSVAVLDSGLLGGGMTQRTTAHLSNAIDDRYVEIERMHGELGARIAARSHSAAIDRIEAIIAAEEIDCDFERLDGYLFNAPDKPEALLENELKAALRAGVTDVVQVARAPIASYDTGMSLRFPQQAQFHPLKYLIALGRALEGAGGRIFTGTHVVEMRGGGDARVETRDGHRVSAEAIVIATNSPINNLVAMHTKQAPYITYVIGARIPSGSVTKALYWDTADPYHYVRIHSVPSKQGGPYDVLIVGGEDHKTGQAHDGDQRYLSLEKWARERFPMIEGIEWRWSGQVLEPVDGLAFIGRNPGISQNVFIATGDSGMGMTHGTIAGILITDLIMERESSWEPLYAPSRKTLRAMGEYAAENINVAAQYASGYLSGGDVGSSDAIAPNEGAVIRSGISKRAAYRDEQGVLHERSALCSHLGCFVTWNNAEKTWDCPCHGSRYDRYGRVIEGPAKNDLANVKAK